MPEPRSVLLAVGPDITRRSWNMLIRAVHSSGARWRCAPSDMRIEMTSDTFTHLAYASPHPAGSDMDSAIIEGVPVHINNTMEAGRIVVRHRDHRPARGSSDRLVEGRRFSAQELTAQRSLAPVISAIRSMCDELIARAAHPGDMEIRMSGPMREAILSSMERDGMIQPGQRAATTRDFMYGFPIVTNDWMHDRNDGSEIVEVVMERSTRPPRASAPFPLFDVGNFADRMVTVRSTDPVQISTVTVNPDTQLNFTSVADGNVDTRMMRAAEKTDSVYAERNALAIAFARMAHKLGWPAGWHQDTDKSEEWATVVIVQFPNGKQISWHMSPDAREMAQTLLPRVPLEWDGTYLGRNMTWPTIFEELL